MAKYHIFYNPVSGSNTGEGKAREIASFMDGELVYYDVTKIENIRDMVAKIPTEDCLVIAGGDGTLYHFVNDVDCDNLKHQVYYYATGTGNDFLRDVQDGKNDHFVRVNSYLKDLPTVEINGGTSHFINGVGYGIDGYCCEVGDKLRETTDKPVNYAGIAIKGLLFHYKPTGATVTVDGVEHRYKKVWLAPTMYGKYYGGGMIPADKQMRNNEKKTVSVMLIHDSGKLSTLMAFPSIFEGKIGEHKKMVDVFEGHDIKVAFDEPRTLQIDGETILNVKEYRVLYK